MTVCKRCNGSGRRWGAWCAFCCSPPKEKEEKDMNKDIRSTMTAFLQEVGIDGDQLGYADDKTIDDAIHHLVKFKTELQLVKRANDMMEDLCDYLIDLSKEGIKQVDTDKVFRLKNELGGILETKR